LGQFVARWIEADEEAALERGRDFARLRPLDRSPLSASLDQKLIREHSRLREVRLASSTVALAAVVDGVFSARSVPVDATLPGAAAAALEGVERPYLALAGEPLWSEIRRAGGRVEFDEIQMARLRRGPLPEPDPRVAAVEDRAELGGTGFSVTEIHFQAGPFFALRDDAGEVLACGGVQFVTDRVVQLAYVWTREDRRRQGLARAVVTELVRALETPERTLVLHVRPENRAAIELYGQLGFRGRRRVALFRFA
jgi:ribosomal protein S18 acetylase RimI-like enzyme